jgi:hypothetical protein
VKLNIDMFVKTDMKGGNARYVVKRENHTKHCTGNML